MKNRDITLSSPLKLWEILMLIALFIIALLAGIIINSTVFRVSRVSNISMQDTLVEGEKLYLNKTAYWSGEPERGDIVVFIKGVEIGGLFHKIGITIKDLTGSIMSDDRKDRLIKRVIGLPGEKLEITDGNVYIDGLKINEDYIKGKTMPYRAKGEIVIPEGMVFVMGDNRVYSSDSRDFGFVDLKSIEGKVAFRYKPFNRMTKFQQPDYTME